MLTIFNAVAPSQSAAPPSAQQSSRVDREDEASTRPSPSVSYSKEQVPLTMERLRNATLLSEKKDAIQILQDAAPKFQAEIGKGIGIIVEALHSDPRDDEVIQQALDILQELVTTKDESLIGDKTLTVEEIADLARTYECPEHREHQFMANSQEFIKDKKNVEILLGLLEEQAPWIRYPTIELLKTLLWNSSVRLQAVILQCPAAMMKLMDVLDDDHDHIRYALLCVLIKLTEKNQELQQFMAFNEGFERLFLIMHREGMKQGTATVADCLQIVSNILADNDVTQKYFLHSPCVANMPDLLSLQGSEPPLQLEPSSPRSEGLSRGRSMSVDLDESKRKCLAVSLKILDMILGEVVSTSPGDAAQDRKKTERRMAQNSLASIPNLLQGVILLSCGKKAAAIGPEIQCLALKVLKNIIEDNEAVQHGLGQMYIEVETVEDAPLSSGSETDMPVKKTELLNPISMLVELELSTTHDKVGSAVSSLLDKLLCASETTAITFIGHTIAPPPVGVDVMMAAPKPPGQLLVEALLLSPVGVPRSPQATGLPGIGVRRPFRACRRLEQVLRASNAAKELALRIGANKDSTGGGEGMTLFSASLKLLGQSLRTQSPIELQVSLFRLITEWLRACPRAIKEMLKTHANYYIFDAVNGSNLAASGAQVLFEDDSKGGSEKDEITQIKGLAALVLGVCIEYVESSPSSAPSSSSSEGGRALGKEAGAKAGTSEISRKRLLGLVGNRIGLEVFTDAMEKFMKIEEFRKASRVVRAWTAGREVSEHGPAYQLYDKAFTKLYKEIFECVQERIIELYTGGNGDRADGSSSDPMKELIRVQDKELKALKQELNTLKSKMPGSDQADEEDEKVRQKEQQHREHLRELQTKLDSTAAEAKRLEGSLAQAQEALKRSQTEFQAAQGRHAQQLANKDQELKGLTLDYQNLEQELQAKEKELKSLQTAQKPSDLSGNHRAESLEKALKQRELELSQTRTELTALRKAKLELEQKAAELTETKNQLQALRLDGAREAADHTALQDAQNELAKVRQAASQREHELARLTGELQQSQGLLQQLQMSQATLGQKEAELNRAKESLEDYEKLRQETEQLRQQLAEATTGLQYMEAWRQEVERVQGLLAQQSAQVLSLQQQLAASGEGVAVQHQAELTLLKEENEEIKQRLQQAEDELSDQTKLQTRLKAEAQAFHDRVRLLETERAAFNAQVETKDYEIGNMNRKIKLCEDEIVKLRAQLSDPTKNERPNKEIDKLKAEILARDKELQRLAAEIEKEVARRHSAEDGLAQLRQSHETLQQQAQAVQAELQAQRRENAAILEKQKRNDKEGEGRPGAANGTHDAALLKALEEEKRKLEELMEEHTDLLVLLANLELEKDAMEEVLREERGEGAVERAISLSRERGAMDLD